MKRILSFWIFTAVISTFLMLNPDVYGEDKKAVYVNRVQLNQQQINALESYYRVRLQNGYFWYDPVAGLWGIEGGPTMGQMLPGLKLGGPLRADASQGSTGVFINGRQIHSLEFLYLKNVFGYVIPGRYWMNAQGIAGFEGGPPQFNLNIASQGMANDWIRRTPGGTIGGSGDCFYYNHPNGSSVMTGCD